MNRAYLIVIALLIIGILCAVLVARSKQPGVGKKTPDPTPTVVSEPTISTASPSGTKKEATPTSKPLTTAVIPLDITTPKDKSTATLAAILVRGTTKPSAEVVINDLETSADSKGNFSGKLTLDEGDNPIVVVAIDEDGNSSEKEIMVTYEIQ